MTDQTVSRAIGKAVVDAVGGRPAISRCADADETHSVAMARFVDKPEPGWETWSTLGLSFTPNLVYGHDIRVELIGVCPVGTDWFGNLLGTASFFVMKDKWVAAPGNVFPEIVRRYYQPDTRLPHLFFTDPFEWPTLADVTLPDGTDIHWLLVFPISDSELAYLQEHGADALTDLFDEKEIEYFDLDREPVI